MRKVLVFNMASLDGFFEGPNRELDWHNVDDEFNQFAIEQLNEVDTLIFGRITYEMMASFWPTPYAQTNDPVVAGLMNSKPKVVISRTLRRLDWENTRLVSGDAVEEIGRIKEEAGQSVIVFGSAALASTLVQKGLVDEYRVMVNPVILGSGSPLFKNIHPPIVLKLLSARTFNNGNILLTYQPSEQANSH